MDEVRLADGRKKAKWSTDPRGTAWANDKEKFGYRMLTKMGWSDGRGLGLNLHGQTMHVKVAAKKDSGGLGLSDDHSAKWVEHQDGFNDILANLQKHSGSEPGSAEQSGRSSPVQGLQAKANQTRSRINYSKFLRGKDLSHYSNADLDCILGKQGTNTASANEEETPALAEDCVNEASDGLTTVTSGQSVQEYFAAKLAKLRGTQASVAETSAPVLTDEDHEASSQADSAEPQMKRKKKSKRQERKAAPDAEDNATAANGARGEAPSNDERQKKKKMKKRDDADKDSIGTVNGVSDDGMSDKEGRKKKKKQKKKKKEHADDILEHEAADDSNVEGNEKRKERKKGKKRRHAEVVSDDDDAGLPKSKRKSRQNETDSDSPAKQERTSLKKKKKKKKFQDSD